MTFRLPPYPYDRLDGLAKLAAALPGGMVDCSIGTPCDPPLPAVVEALATSGAERGYPASAGSVELREAAALLAGPAVRARRGPGVLRRRLRGHQGTRCVRAARAAPARAGQGHRAVSRGVVPHLCHGRRAGGLPGRCRPVAARSRRGPRPRCDRRRRRGAGTRAVVELPLEPDRRPRRPRRRSRLGPGPRRPRVLRRVLHGVHLGGAAAFGAPTRCGRRGGRALTVQAIESRRRPGGVLRRRRRPGGVLAPRYDSMPA